MDRGIHRLNPVDMLLVEDNPGDVLLVKEVFRESGIPHRMQVAEDGEEAMAILRAPGETLPQIILLDLNLPRKSGLEVLSEIKQDDRLKKIPVVVVTTSMSRRDILQSYERHANCYITKPVDFDQFMNVLRSIGDFWLTVATLPERQ
ncbi:MAG: response regulator [Deltaproteobacteria bacterium]|nr:response regulator [Deltaproteobacteria bacterium]PWB67705.1 MAG: response regulator [Deltaproteobacteria bacterium]